VSREAYVTVTVGFAPATTPGLVTGGTTAAADGTAPDGLFAALLAMLAPGQTIDAATEAAASEAADKITSTDFAALIQTLTTQATSPAKEPEAVDGEPQEADDAEETSEAAAIANPLGALDKAQGKSLLKDLGDALIALNDSIEAGRPIDPALEKKLSEAIDALAIYLGALTPTGTTTTRITELASGDGVIPATSNTDLPPPAPSTPAAAAPPAAAPAAGAVPTAVPEATEPAPATDAVDAPELPEQFAKLVADIAPETTETLDSAAPEPAPSKGATTLEAAPLALRQLGLSIGQLSEKLAAQDPELARKLDALAETLKSGALPDALKAALGPDEATTEREIKRIIEALATPRPATAKPVEARSFTAPTLELPQTIAAPAKKDEPAATVATTEPVATPKLESSEPEIARPIAASTIAKTEKPEATDNKPAPTPVPTSQPQAAATDTAAGSATQIQPAAAPAARNIHAAYQAPLQQVNLPQVAFEVVRQFEAGNTRFQIRLDPPELGRIDVKLDVDKSGAVNARLTVERPETLDLMQRDQRALQQALQQAGLDGQKTNLEFSLRQNPFAQQGGTGDGQGDHQGFNGRGDSFAGEDDVGAETAGTTYRGTASASGLNLFV
jgi:flagellar hook-length control protein FliK